MNSFVPTWTKWWMLLAGLICIWDASFVLLRPRTMPGGDLHKFWAPYALYIQVDHLYGDLKDTFVFWVAILNLIEVYIFLATVLLLTLFSSQKAQIFGAFSAIIGNAFTFWKTVIYILYGLKFADHNDNFTYITLYIIPNGFWIVVPLLSMIAVSKRIGGHILREKVKQN